jgi:hypothetical protein
MKDPLDELQAFYENCHAAELPGSLTTTVSSPRNLWLGSLAGLAIGLAVACLVIQAPAPLDDEKRTEAVVDALVASKLPPPPPNIRGSRHELRGLGWVVNDSAGRWDL